MAEQSRHEARAGTSYGHIPDLKWVNRRVPIRDVCKQLGLHFGPGDMIHCWHPDRHKNGDRTPSVSIKRSANRVRCFGCGSKTLSVVDLVMDVESTDVGGAARWLQRHFELGQIPKGRHLGDPHAIQPYMVGYEKPIELLVKSGLWAELQPPTQRIVPVLLYFAECGEKSGTFKVQISYLALQRYSGVRSFQTISKALEQLTELDWLVKVSQPKTDAAMLRDVTTYILTPYSDGLLELANATAAAARTTIQRERELRRQERNLRRDAAGANAQRAAKDGNLKPGAALLQSTSLYNHCSVGQNCATQIVAANVTREVFSSLVPRQVGHRIRRTVYSWGHEHRQKRSAAKR
jgi:hypothetical protein